jgi:hypothetical protein
MEIFKKILVILSLGIVIPAWSQDKVSYQTYSQHQVLLPVPVSLTTGYVNQPPRHVARIYIKNRQLRPQFFQKAQTILEWFEKEGLRNQILDTAQLYGLDPLHLIGPLLADRVMYYNIFDDLQNLILRDFIGHPAPQHLELRETLKDPSFLPCHSYSRQADYWDCVGSIWNHVKTSKINVDLREGLESYFALNIGGASFGLGQMSLLRLLMVTDIVHQISGWPQISVNDWDQVYQTILDPRTHLHYMAATMKLEIERYGDIANFDISKNPGLTATLYNVGQETQRAKSLYDSNLKRLSRELPLQYPRLNHFGWVVNESIPQLNRWLYQTD